MKIFKKSLKYTLVFLTSLAFFIACDKDFATIDSDIINEETATNFNATSEKYDVISYTDALGPVQTNTLPLNMLGVYIDPTYGRTTASIVTQVSPGLVNQTFGDNVVLDSVVLTIPYFSRNTGVTEDGTTTYDLDSILPKSDDYADIKLSIFENNYLLRSFDPNADFNTPQAFFSNKSASVGEQISDMSLEGTPIQYYKQEQVFGMPDILSTDNIIKISNKAIILKVPNTDPNEDPVISQRLAPALRLKLDESFWLNKIISQSGTAQLSNANNFNDYFRGIYFKAEAANANNGSLINLNLSNQGANIVLYYTKDSSTIDGERDQNTYTLTFGPNRINFLENDFTTPIVDGNQTEGDSQLFIKGGEGSIAKIKLFNGENSDDDDSADNVFELWRKEFVNLDADGNFVSSKRLINEANLVFYVDQSPNGVKGQEPERLYLYDYTNSTPLSDYFLDADNNTLPLISISNHLGILQRDEDNKGVKYKMRITNHLNNILINNRDNVELGLAITGNINLEGSFTQRLEQTTDNSVKRIPISALINPRGTILHGNRADDLSNRLFLEIFYTCLNSDSNCPQDN